MQIKENFNMFHVFALTYYILLRCVTQRVQYDVITRAVHETCFCCRSCNGRFFFYFQNNLVNL